MNLSDRGVTDFVDGAYVSGGMFEMLGVQAVRGRTITEADDRRDGGADGPVAVISYAFWQRRFGGAADVVGRRLTIERTPFVVVGVAPKGFFGPDVGRACDLFVPIGTEAAIRGQESSLDSRLTWWLNVMARLKPGQTLEEANQQLRAVQPQIREATHPDIEIADYLSGPLTLSSSAGGRSTLRNRYREPLVILLVVVGAVLLIACANIANLLLARVTARRRELVVRLALGASRLRLARELLIESLLLAVGGALLGLGVARAGSALLVSQLTTATTTVVLDTSLDWRVLGFTVGATLLTALVFGVAPAAGMSRVRPNEALKEQNRSVSGDRRFGLRNVLVVTEVALSLVLIVAAALFVRTFTSLLSTPLGFNPSPLLVAEINMQHSDAPIDQRLALAERLREAAGSVPGATSAAISLLRPVSGQGWNSRVKLDDSSLTDRQRQVFLNAVSPGWFSTYGMRLIAGRDVQSQDKAAGPKVAVVNQMFVDRFFGGGPIVGRQITVAAPRQPSVYDVVGVVSNAVYRNIREGVTPTIYVPFTQMERPWPNSVLVVAAASGARASLQRSVADVLARTDGKTAFTLHLDSTIFCGPRSRRNGWWRCCPASSAVWRCCLRVSVSMA